MRLAGRGLALWVLVRARAQVRLLVLVPGAEPLEGAFPSHSTTMHAVREWVASLLVQSSTAAGAFTFTLTETVLRRRDLCSAVRPVAPVHEKQSHHAETGMVRVLVHAGRDFRSTISPVCYAFQLARPT